MNREVKQAVEAAQERGWLREPSRNNHIKLRHPKTRELVVFPSSPSCGRSVKNTLAIMRRIEKQASGE
jgi:predicted RNA binding protein YcfA (HicA-like mRNA interferase family)